MPNNNSFIYRLKDGSKSFAAIFFIILLTSCTTEHNYRGVPSPHWQELSGEQKQLIVDQAYEKEFGSTDKKSGN
ncbi:MAG: hypothetical protein KKE11_03310 [Gammaproteobacteria bacterium]|nr:hypothetical protein [Gammaproteobacteria bacterium]